MNKISLAKRLNNNKRGYLIINANQGKHRPALIEDVKNEYETLAKLSEGILKNALVIGFAETAIAIGATLAGSAGAYFMQTTRENICAEYIYFTEAHSHAMEQRLVLPDIKAIYDKVERIVFVEDEITTGNTIWHCIEEIESIFNGNKKYAIAPLTNTLSDNRKNFFKEKNIDIIYIQNINKESFEEDVLYTVTDGDVYRIGNASAAKDIKYIDFKTDIRTRRLLNIKDLDDEIVRLENTLEENIDIKNLIKDKKIITVLGTEEFIYVPIRLAEYIDKNTEEFVKVYVHSSTRSPIEVSKEDDYPLNTRYEVKSIYDKNRQTYIYDLKNSDIFFLVSDGKDKIGENDILEAIRLAGNKDIYFIRWNNEQQLYIRGCNISFEGCHRYGGTFGK